MALRLNFCPCEITKLWQLKSPLLQTAKLRYGSTASRLLETLSRSWSYSCSTLSRVQPYPPRSLMLLFLKNFFSSSSTLGASNLIHLFIHLGIRAPTGHLQLPRRGVRGSIGLFPGGLCCIRWSYQALGRVHYSKHASDRWYCREHPDGQIDAESSRISTQASWVFANSVTLQQTS